MVLANAFACNRGVVCAIGASNGVVKVSLARWGHFPVDCEG